MAEKVSAGFPGTWEVIAQILYSFVVNIYSYLRILYTYIHFFGKVTIMAISYKIFRC